MIEATQLHGIHVVEVDLGTRFIPYEEAWNLQRELHQEVVSGDSPNTLLLLEHEPVYTAGSRTRPEDLPTDNSEVVNVDRGGRITWHGPGQLVGYPILRLPHPMDVVAHIREMESLLITLCAQFGVGSGRVADRSGVWVSGDGRDNKIAAVGVRVSQGVTMHGFAVNCDCDLSWADPIVPCGISDAGVTSLSRETDHDITALQVAHSLKKELRQPMDTATRS